MEPDFTRKRESNSLKIRIERVDKVVCCVHGAVSEAVTHADQQEPRLFPQSVLGHCSLCGGFRNNGRRLVGCPDNVTVQEPRQRCAEPKTQTHEEKSPHPALPTFVPGLHHFSPCEGFPSFQDGIRTSPLVFQGKGPEGQIGTTKEPTQTL